ncbi:MAG: DNA mismatch repair endonuclease MutL [Saprospiraceae bacterium]|nr:DNA mismatch repair endonuclease MutL [Saprospiraceae bacterium]
MGDIIKLLPDAIANQIAAGEVIQRPASVVKELLENALDASSTRIQLILKDGGKQLIQVVDDGCGMSVTDARMSFERHATSKIRNADDLFHIRTMGFRGEALASIASVAQVELRTRREEDTLGTRILIEGTTVKAQEDCATVPGTNLSVRNLFYNVPARRKFLKSDTVEMRHILEEFQRTAIAHPDIHFSLHHNDQEVYHLPPANQRQRVVAVLGPNSNKKMIPVDEDADQLSVSGFVGRPEAAKKSRGEQYLYVNRRFIRSGYLHHAILSAFEELIGDDQHPLYVLFMEIDPERIDVNVHPTKHEIKFEDERLIYHFVKVSVRHALGQYHIVPTLDFEPDHSVASSKFAHGTTAMMREKNISQISGKEQRTAATKDWQELFTVLQQPLEAENPNASLGLDDPLAPAVTLKSGPAEGEQLSNHANERTPTKPYQIQQTYILTPIKSGFILIDQQAAHERILYEQYLDQLKGQPARIQKELFPRTIELNPVEGQVIRTLLADLLQLGFDLQEFGQNTFILHGVPANLLPGQDALMLIQRLLEQHKQDHPLKAGNQEALAMSLARQAAYRRGTTLDEDTMQYLIDRLFACSVPYKSPRGRHCFITYELEELSKRFAG